MNPHLRRYTLLATVALAASLAAISVQGQGAKVGVAGAGDKLAGEKKADACIGCHGIPDYKASFPTVYRVPKIGGQGEKYIATALAEYKKGDRKHPTMHAMASTLSDQDIADLAAFYAGEANPVPVVSAAAAVPTGAAAELIKRGNCASCHGANFDRPIDPSYPKLAGQHPDYLYQALLAYQTDHNPSLGRNNPIMMGMARPFSHAELKLMAEHIASLPSELNTRPQSRWR